jgi:hypothetical protein
MKNINNTNIPEWLKSKGYLHLSPSLKIGDNWRLYKNQIEKKDFISRYAFYPLIHAFIKERKYKKADPKKHRPKGRSHKHFNLKKNIIEGTAKLRPLHYASHFDSLIYSYYASELNIKYEEKLKQVKGLTNSITAYRKLKLEGTDKGKSTIHFAKEVFDEIVRRTENGTEVAVLAFDIKGFFSSLDHNQLKARWSFMVDETRLPNDHYNVFKSCTNFSYVLLDDLRKRNNRSGKKSGYDESKLAKIRREKGFKCFFESNEEFRNHIKKGKLSVYKNPFCKGKVNKKISMGIPQGLPISAVLANIYLYDFDKDVIENIVNNRKGFYRRYSDDIIVICNVDDIKFTKEYVEKLILESEVEISKEKTETFIFKYLEYNTAKDKRLTSVKINHDNSQTHGNPLIYLGFEFRGYNVSVKSTNLARYYRRLISIVKRRCKRARNGIKNNPQQTKAVFLNQIKKLYNEPVRELDAENKELKQKKRNKTTLVLNEKGEFSSISKKVDSKNKNSNYLGYLKRCEKIFESKTFLHQVRKRKHIVRKAIKKHLAD